MLTGLFLISMVFYLFSNTRSERRVLFFPDEMNRIIKGETRSLPLYDTEEENIALLVKELLLGPEYIYYGNTVPQNSKLNTIILRKDTLYLDFSIDLILEDSECSLEYDEIINLIKKTVIFNFKHIRTVNITIEGQIPASW